MDIKVNENTVVVFDLDDTLYNELDFLKSAYISIAKSLDKENWKFLYTKMFSLYRSNFNVFEILSDTYKIGVSELVSIYRNHTPKIELFNGAKEVLLSIKNKGGNLAIISDGRSTTQRAKLKALGIIDLFDKIIISEETGSEKPSLANFQSIESDFKAQEYWYIADNLKKDFIAPNELGWYSVGLVDNGKNIHYESYKYLEPEFRPSCLVFDFYNIKIV